MRNSRKKCNDIIPQDTNTQALDGDEASHAAVANEVSADGGEEGATGGTDQQQVNAALTEPSCSATA